jgi:ParB family transcriptional regulator, chromosome partitioning protein
MSSKAAQLGAGASFGRARPVSARRAAIGAATGAPTEGVPDPTELPVALISQNPDNPRDHLRDLEGLTQSIAELGVINAITVASVDAYLHERLDRANDLEDGATHVVIDGHRRLEGSRRAGKTTIKVLVDNARVASDEALLEAAFVANFHRDNMTDLEQAHALEALVKFYGNQTQASQRLGISQATISSKLSLLKLSPDLQAELASGQRQVEHVRNLGKLNPEKQRAAADARANEAKRRAERKRASQDSRTIAASADDPQPTDDYHAVISEATDQTTTEPPCAEAGTSTRKLTADSLSAGVLLQSDGQDERQVSGLVDAHEAISPGDHADTVPWHDVHTLAVLIRDRMPYEKRTELTVLLQAQNREDLKTRT